MVGGKDTLRDPNDAKSIFGESLIWRTTNGGAGWTRLSVGQSSRLYGVSFSSLTSATVVGGSAVFDLGIILRTTNSGNTWLSSTTGTYVCLLLGVSYGTPSTGIVVGNNGTILRTTDGGATWNPRPSGTTNALRGVWLADAYNGFAVGDSMTILQTTDGGLTWASQSSGSNSSLYAVSFVDPIHGIIVGEGGAILSTTPPGSVVAVRDYEKSVIPSQLSLSQNYPNPFNASTRISFTVGKSGFTSLKVFDVLGRQVTTLVNQDLKAGRYETTFDAAAYASGVYYYSLQSREGIVTRKLLLLK